VDSGQQITGLVVQLNPQGSIGGKVLDEDGQPVPDATVQAYTTYAMRGKLQLRRGNSTSTGKTGEYTLKKLNPGKYYLSAELAKHPNNPTAKHGVAPAQTESTESAVSNDMGYVRTFYPNALDFQSATTFEVTPGQHATDAEIRLKKAITYQVRGKIAQEGGIGRATVLLSPRDTLDANVLGMNSRVARDGTFEFTNVLPGAYTLWLIGSFHQYGGFRLLGRQDIDVSASNIVGIVLSLTPPITLTGHISGEGIDKQHLATLRVNFVPSGQVMMGNFQGVAVDENGKFTAQNLAPGTYSVRVNNSLSGAYVKEVTYNGQDITMTGLDVSNGGAGEIEITIHSGVGEVDGTIQADSLGRSGPGEVAVLVPDDVGPDGYGTLTGPVSGKTFAIRNVPPGHYYAYAVSYWDSVWQNSDFLHEIQREGMSIDIEENARKQIELPVISSDDVEVTAARLGLTSR
jgi:hypothetical protein